MTGRIIYAVLAICIAGMVIVGCGTKKKCMLTVDTTYGGTDEFGEDLRSGSFTETFEVEEGAVIYEDFGGHFTTDSEGKNSSDISFTIKKITATGVVIIAEKHEKVISFGEKADRPSVFFVADGVNYYHTITFEKNN